MTQHPMGAPSLFDDGEIGTGIPSSSQPQSKVQTINLIDLMHDGFYIVFLIRNQYLPGDPAEFRQKILDLLNRFEPVSYTHLTLPTIYSV